MGPDRAALSLRELLFPDRDADFGAVVQRLSGPETGRPADNFVSNEDSYPRVCGELSRRAPRGTVYLGVGPDQNFTLVAHARPTLAFVVDFRRRNLLLHLLHKALFALSADRVAYLTRLTARIPVPVADRPTAAQLVAAFADRPLDRALLERTQAEVAEYLRPYDVLAAAERAELASIQARLAGPGMAARFLALRMYPTFARQVETPDRAGHPAHMLAQEELYREVRDRQLGDLVVPLVGDFAGASPWPVLGDWLRRHRLWVGVLYISDVEFFLLRAGRLRAYAENLARLPWDDSAVLIRTSTREIEHPERVAGDSSTTILRAVGPFLEAARAGRVTSNEDLFAPEPA